MWSPFYWYFEIRGKADYTVKLPRSWVNAVLSAQPALECRAPSAYSTKGEAWLDITAFYSEEGNYGSEESLRHPDCTLLSIVASRRILGAWDQFVQILSSIAKELNWELILESDDGENENVVLYAVNP